MSTKKSDAFPHHPKDVSTEWLTHRLKAKHLLNTGFIEFIEVKPLGGVYLAQSAIVDLTYSKTASGIKPSSIFIKIARPDVQFGNVTAGEVEFFQNLKPPAHLPIAPCLDICVDEDSGFSCLLIQDLSQTHTQHSWPLPATVDECHAVLRALAQIHAFWWNAQELPSLEERSLFQVRQKNIFTQLQKLLPKFLQFIGDRLSSERQQIMLKVCDCLPELMSKRILQTQSTTLIHGDAHFWNVMLPKNPQTHGPLFIDWEEWTCGITGYDLAYMIALQWHSDRRKHHEMLLLESYYQELIKKPGVNYSFDELIHDYKLGCLRNFIIPAFHLEMGIEPYIWWPLLERLYLAYEDLECEKLI